MPTTPLVESGLSRVLRLSLTGLALLFWGAALGALLGHGPRVSLGPVRISALDVVRKWRRQPHGNRHHEPHNERRQSRIGCRKPPEVPAALAMRVPGVGEPSVEQWMQRVAHGAERDAVFPDRNRKATD